MMTAAGSWISHSDTLQIRELKRQLLGLSAVEKANRLEFFSMPSASISSSDV